MNEAITVTPTEETRELLNDKFSQFFDENLFLDENYKGKRKYTASTYKPEKLAELEEMYEGYFEEKFPDGDFRAKELVDSEMLNVHITSIKNNIAIAESKIGQSIVIDLTKEEKAIGRLGFPPLEMQVGSCLDVVVFKDRAGQYNGSVSQGYENTLKKDLRRAMRDNDSAYQVKVVDLCPGGFMVNLSGIKCFLPGSLAAANRIIDFAGFVGKTIMVMVETYDERRDIFVVSFKKYLKNVIVSKVSELSFVQKYTGTVTGTSSAGVFVEWDEFYTGLIPAEDFSPTEGGIQFRSGDRADFYVMDLKNPNRIVLTTKEPDNRSLELQKIKDVSLSNEKENKIYIATITKVKNFGVFVKLDNDLNGLVERDELERDIKDYRVGDTIECNILDVDIQSARLHFREKYPEQE